MESAPITEVTNRENVEQRTQDLKSGSTKKSSTKTTDKGVLPPTGENVLTTDENKTTTDVRHETTALPPLGTTFEQNKEPRSEEEEQRLREERRIDEETRRGEQRTEEERVGELQKRNEENVLDKGTKPILGKRPASDEQLNPTNPEDVVEPAIEKKLKTDTKTGGDEKLHEATTGETF